MNCLWVVLAFLTIAPSAIGGTIAITSGAATTTNDSALPTINIVKHPAWANPLPGSEWVSTRNSGDPSSDDFFEFTNGTTVTFSHSFIIPTVATDGLLSVRADDTAAVKLNGVLLVQPSLGQGTNCASQPIGCLTSTTGVLAFSQLQPFLVTGVNVFSFEVQQVASAAFGLSYGGHITFADSDDPVHTPEPAAFVLSATGLAMGAVIALRRRRSRTAPTN